VATTTGMKTTAVETPAGNEGNTREATATERPVETTMMEAVMMKEPEPEPYGNAVCVIRQ
jgi:hypothetical protein